MQYRKKPVVIDAVQWDGGGFRTPEYVGAPAWMFDARAKAQGTPGSVWVEPENPRTLRIMTLEGTMLASPGDWIIKGIKGELYPCKPYIFEATYEPA